MCAHGLTVQIYVVHEVCGSQNGTITYTKEEGQKNVPECYFKGLTLLKMVYISTVLHTAHSEPSYNLTFTWSCKRKVLD